MSKQLTLDLAVFLGPPKPSTHIEALLGLTDWVKTSEQPPPFLGWWRTWNELGRVQRQWWNGHIWSIPMPQGESAWVANEYMNIASMRDHGSVVWCGLRKPHLAGYLEYRLVPSPRVTRWGKLHDAG